MAEQLHDASDKKEECSICLGDFDRLCVFSPCKHSCVCLTCYLEIDCDPILKMTPTIKECPLCRTEIRYCNHSDLSNPENNFQSLEGQGEFYKFAVSYITILPKISDAQGFVETVVHAYQNVVEKHKRPCLLSTHQTEVLLTKMREGGHSKDPTSYWRFNNLFVCLCATGWDVDSNLGGCGVCYFGNTGVKMTSVEKFTMHMPHKHNMLIRYSPNEYF